MTASGLRTGKVAHDLFLLRGVSAMPASECLEVIGVTNKSFKVIFHSPLDFDDVG